MSSTAVMALSKVIEGVSLFFNIISVLIFAYAIMTWIMRPDNVIFRIVGRFVQPLLAPFRPIARKLIEKGLMIDITVLLAYLAISLTRSAVIWFLTWILYRM